MDHIEPAGSLNCSNDLPAFVDTLFCEVDNLQTLCKTCHDEKTQLERKLKQFKKYKKIKAEPFPGPAQIIEKYNLFG